MPTIPLPQQATCCQCKQEFPVKAVMSLPGGSIPMLVVVQEVTSVEEAIERATCQLCLKKEGPKDRGLHGVLMALGCIEATLPTSLSLPSRSRPSAPTLDLAALAKARHQGRGPTMAGVRVVMPPPLPRGNFRPAPPREQRLDDYPRLPKVLEKPAVREPEPVIEPLGHTMAESYKQAAQAARVAAGERIALILDILRVIREDALKMDIEDRVTALVERLNEAVRLDPDQRGRKKIYEILGTSEAELSDLRMLYWMLLHGSHRGIVKGCELEEVEENPFPNARRPRHFDKDGEGRQIALRPVIVVRTKSVLPTPNSPLGEPGDPLPKIIYPDGGRYGRDFTVQGSRRSTRKDLTWSWRQVDVAVWSLDHENATVTCNGVVINLCDLMCSYMEPYVLPESQEPPQEVEAEGSDAAAEGQPHAEV